ncbi:NAD(P)-dependent oxidoreductase [Brevundimonas sp. Leaf363]|uniref:dTDP-4-dehydrorhamnose reductase n=1 Tax=Brevundimonas sp. Leaf363 TaxID=1736353 RepID=UPI0006F6052F|nr:dTDP-4-dehydrorhamnose reductase [Brevundimonas sp. Leaf363]KQS52881.1 NAD(P)-dependent oxidoreductase [Brevundimonas sp. Leaf363]
MAEPVHILVTGGAGQVGLALRRAAWPAEVVIHAPDHAELDITDPAAVAAAFARTPFKAVINAAAYTAVDKAETDREAAFAVNATAPGLLAAAAARSGAAMLQVSTDYVFDGSKSAPYVEDDAWGPLGVYGASKLAGEQAVLAAHPRAVILRTAWVLSPDRANFLKTMLRLAADRPALRVVEDQIGCPTSAADIAETLKTLTLRFLADPGAPSGVYHFVNAGETSWAGLARHILTLSAARGGPTATVEGIPTTDYPTPARRPANSRLATDKIARDFAIHPRPWQDAVAEIVDQLLTERAAA